MFKSLTAKQILAVVTWIRGYYGMPENMQNHDYQSGGEGFFIPLSDTLGLKMYRSTEQSKRYFYWHKIIAAVGMGPKVFELGSVKITSASGEHEYGWFTVERVLCVDKILSEIDDSEERSDLYYQMQAEMTAYADELEEILGIRTGDMHGGNYGYLNGKFVAVDIGSISVYDPKPSDWDANVIIDWKWLFAHNF